MPRSPAFAAPGPANRQAAEQIAAAGAAPAAACTAAAAAYSFDIATLGLPAASAGHTARTALPGRSPGACRGRARISTRESTPSGVSTQHRVLADTHGRQTDQDVHVLMHTNM